MELIWFLFAIAAPFCWAMLNVVEKVVISKFVKKYFLFNIIASLFGLVGLFLLPLVNFNIIGVVDILIFFIGGFLMFAACFVYMKVLSGEEVSRTVPLFRFVAVFTLILSTVFLGEKFTLIKYLAFFVMLVGGFLISSKDIKNIKETFTPGRGFLLMILSCFLFAGYDFLTKCLFLKGQSYWNVFVMLRLTVAFWALVLLFTTKHAKELVSTVRKMSNKVKISLIFAEIVALLGVAFSFAAIQRGSLPLTNVLEAFQPFFILVYAIILSHKFPQLLKEEINRKVLITKITAIALMFIGVIMLNIR